MNERRDAMLLSDFYQIFPEYPKAKFSIKFVRNEIYVLLNYHANSNLIIQYLDDDNMTITIADDSLKLDFQTRNQIRHQYPIGFNQRDYPYCKSNMRNLRQDAEKLKQIVSGFCQVGN